MAVWINEIHYDNSSTDTNEGVEIAAPAGTSLAGWTIVLYNGTSTPNAATTYPPVISLSGTIPDNGSGFGTLWFNIAGLQNGSFDGFALVDANGAVVQFLSYEGVITASNGPAAGMTSTDIGVSQAGTQSDAFTLQLQGTGGDPSDFVWAAGVAATRGGTNTGQTFTASAPVQSLSIADAGVTEGNSGTTQISFTVTRANGTTGAVAATWTVSFGTGATAADAGDFAAAQALTGTVEFAEGETTKTIVLNVAGDAAIEETETFTVTLSAPTNGATLSDATATGTITNDDFPVIPGASIADAAIVEGDAGTANLVFTVTLSAGPTGPVTIDFATANGSATAGSDYVATSGTISFAAGETSKTISIPVNGDTVGELRETFTVTLSNPSGATLADGSAIGTITDNDGPVYHNLAAGNLTQDWSNIDLITADDDWSGVPSIIGYRGDELTGATGTNPQTITGTSNVVDVIANQTSTGSSSGGVAEFHIADPTIGLQGSGTADAPHIVLYLDSTGRQNVVVSYRLRDLDAVDNAAQQVALQYRVGGTGPWIDVPAAFVNDATTGPNLLGPDTLVSVTLPEGANNQPRLEVRIITTNAVGNDEWVGIDDIVVSSTLGQASLAIADASVAEGNADATPITFTVIRTGDSAGTVTADYTVNFTGNATADDFAAGTPLSGTVTFGDGETSRTITVTVAGDVAPENDETFTVSLSNVVGGTTHDASATGTILNDDGLPPSVTIDDVSRAEGNDGTTTLTFTVTRTGGTQAFTIDYATTGGNATAGDDYTATSGTLSFAEGETAQTITVTVAGDKNGEPNETFQVQLSNPTGFAVIADSSGTGTIVNDDPIFIHDIQGTAYYSPILAAEGKTGFNVASTTTVIVQAVVTALDGHGSRQGFYITEEFADWDGFDSSSEGIFVMTRNDANVGTALADLYPGLKVGDLVTVTAQVIEYQSFTSMPRTMLVNSTVTINASGLALPTLVLNASRPIPNSILTGVTPDYTDSSDGEGDSFDVSLYGLSFWESVEGMLVTIPDMVVADGFVQTSGGQPYFKAYSAVHADADQVNSRGGYTIAGDPPLSPPDTVETDDGTTHGGRHLHDGDMNPDIIEVDFSGFAINAPAGLTQTATMGDRLGDITGIVEFDFADLKLFVTGIDPAAITNTVPVQETTELGNDSRALTVATFNVENLDPGDGAARFAAIANAIAKNLNAPDIISIEEMQDNNGAVNTGGSDASVTWQMLVDALNAAIPGARYQWVDQAPVPNSEGGEPGGNIRVGFLYNTNRVQLGDLPADATIEERRQFTDRIGDGVRDAGDRIAFSDDMVAGEINPADWSGTRLSLLGQFTFNGNTVYVTANHFPAKGGSGEFWQFNQNLETGDPDNSGWAKRNAVAQDVYAVLNHIEANSNGAGVVAAGDFNDFYFYRPLEVVTGFVLADGTARSGGARFDNLTVTELAEAERYTYTFDGRSQAIDHIIVNQKLSAVASYDIVHLNTGYNSRGTGADANPAISDHDPAVASFDFRSFAETLTGTPGNDSIDGEGGNDTILLTGGGDDTASGGEGNDFIYYGAAFTNADSSNGGAGFDRVGLFGNYTLTFDADDLVGIERLEVYGRAAVGAPDAASYSLTTIDANVAAGTTLVVTAASLAAGETLVFNGTAETDGSFTVHGGAGNDIIAAGAGADYLFGNGGTDELYGLGGNDHLFGGGGADALRGGHGRDVFHYRQASDSGTAEGASDRIADFQRGLDKIDLSAIDAGSEAGDQAFTFIGEAAFSGAGQLRSSYDAKAKAWRVEGDIDGDGTADFAILVVAPNQGPLAASDFVL
jgi:predicted extracellular nuclease